MGYMTSDLIGFGRLYSQGCVYNRRNITRSTFCNSNAKFIYFDVLYLGRAAQADSRAARAARADAARAVACPR